jgi:lipopolysaccharide biosynthesis protein
MKRLCIFAHYDRDNIVDRYVLNYLQGLRSVAQHIVFVSTSRLTDPDIETLGHLCDSVITRENIGYDFMSWQAGLASIDDIAAYDELIVCNDSVYGPLYPLENVFDTMARQTCDFWGITGHRHRAFHLQSYFIVFKRHMTDSKPFREFWRSITPEESKATIVEKYEIGLTDGFVKEGFKPATYVHYSPSYLRYLRTVGPPWTFQKCLWLFVVVPLSGVVPRWNTMALRPEDHFPITHAYWKEIIVRHKMPFLKIEVLRHNPIRVCINNYERVIAKHSDYDVTLIKNHLRRMNGVDSPACS